MSFEQPPQEKKPEAEKSAKELAWEKNRKKIEETRDATGEEVDEEVKETVIAFNMMGLPTVASCEGHTDHGIGAPWVEVSAPAEPEERFVGEKEIFQKVADKYGITFEQVKRGLHQEAWGEALRGASKNEESPEFKEWDKENKKLQKKVEVLIKEFYQDREVPVNVRLEVSEGVSEFRVHNGGDDYRPVLENLADEERIYLGIRLEEYRKEMQAFGQFLKEKYFGGE